MKKQLNKIVLLLLSVVVLSSCESDDKAIDQVFDGVEYGAVLRKLEITSASYNLTDLNSAFSVIVEEQDEEYGALLSEVDVYVSKTMETKQWLFLCLLVLLLLVIKVYLLPQFR